ncbi:hypothetical protein RFI_00222, partial [Reticulomyxa filosa]
FFFFFFLKKKNLIGYGFEVDYWSIGVILYLMLVGHSPYDEKQGNLLELVKAGNFSFPSRSWKYVTPEAKDLVQNLMQVDPAKRFFETRITNKQTKKKKSTKVRIQMCGVYVYVYIGGLECVLCVYIFMDSTSIPSPEDFGLLPSTVPTGLNLRPLYSKKSIATELACMPTVTFEKQHKQTVMSSTTVGCKLLGSVQSLPERVRKKRLRRHSMPIGFAITHFRVAMNLVFCPNAKNQDLTTLLLLHKLFVHIIFIYLFYYEMRFDSNLNFFFFFLQK